MKHSPDFSSRFRILKGGKISLVVSALIASVTMLHAAPSGGVVTSGSASIAHNGGVTTINQSSQKASINWQNFSISATETVNFNQPNVSTITLNRVIGNEKSIIDGALNANGQVWILNSNGVLFNSSAKVNTAGLLATTMNLSDEDFQNGAYSFKGDSTASVINLGEITIRDGGYASLLANSVQNEGSMKAIHGTVTLTGASEATINLNGNSLVSLKVDKGVLDALIENKGAIYADGGNVYLTTNAVNELLKGVVNNTGIIEANSLEDVTGEIILFAHGGALHVNGTLEAEGGFIETSGKSLHVEDSTIIKTKKWLLDPDNIIIESAGGGVGGESVSATAVQNALGTADIELQATYDITVNENITWATDKKLTLTAGDEVYVNATIKNTNTTNGGVYFNAANVHNKVIFGANGKVIIYNPYQLQWMNQALAGKYELGSDIDASVTSSWNSGKGWMPIVTSEELVDVMGMTTTNYYGFSGTFDGLGHTISNLTINDATKDYVGFFGQTAGATIQNVGLVNVTITAKDSVGALVGMNDATSTIKNAYATGSVSGSRWIGGLAGHNRNSSTIENSYAIVTVSATGQQVGGLVGNRASDSPIINSYASGTVTGTSNVGGLVGFYSGGYGGVTSSYYDKEANTGTMGDTGYGKTKAELLALVTDGTWNNTIWGTDGSQAEGYADNKGLPFLKDVTNTLFNSGYGTSANPYTITNWTQLQNINYASDSALLSKYYTLSNNIDSTTTGYTNIGEGWLPIGNVAHKFKGNFNGGGHTISNLTINRAGDYIGLFGYTQQATIQNIGLVSVDVRGKRYVGGLVGVNDDATIKNSYVSGSVLGSDTIVGGLVGYNFYGTITNSYATGGVTGLSFVGGLVGRHYLGNISKSYSTANVSGGSYVGGLVGFSDDGGGSVTNSFWDTSVFAISAGGTGKTTAELKKFSTFDNAGWDVVVGTSETPALSMGGSHIWMMAPESLSYTLSNVSNTYKGTAYNLTDLWNAEAIFGTGFSGWVLGTDYTFLDSTDAVVTGYTNAGTYSNITIDILKSGYTEASSGNTAGALTIDKKALTISGLAANNKTYDGTTSVVMTNWGSLSGLVGIETLTLGHGTASFDTATVGNGKTVTAIDYTLSDGDNGGVVGNYLLAATTATTTANITAVIPQTQDITPIITQIINGTAITPPVIPNFTPPPQALQSLNAGGVMLQLASVPSGNIPSQIVGTPEARAMMQGGAGEDLRVPLGQNSLIQLINGGVRLPEGLEQQFFMAQR